MVCKINFDYEILISDNNDSISSTELTSEEEYSNKKFSLGDNILDPNPLKIISVRQLNNFSQSNPNESNVDSQTSHENICKKIPMNNYHCYDESISNFEEESVSECEFDSYFDSGIINKNDFNCSNSSWTYELPIVSRFQVLPQQTIKESSSIGDVNRYCINEKLKRLQTTSNVKEPVQYINPGKKSQDDAEKISQIKTKDLNILSSSSIDQSTLSPGILSELPIDLLTEFINGKKTENEVLKQKKSSKKSYKKRKRSKKSKRLKYEPEKNFLYENNTVNIDLSNNSLSNYQQMICQESSNNCNPSDVDNNNSISTNGNLPKEETSTIQSLQISNSLNCTNAKTILDSKEKLNESHSVKQSDFDEVSSLKSFSYSTAFNCNDKSQKYFNSCSTIDEKQILDNDLCRNSSIRNTYQNLHQSSVSEEIRNSLDRSTKNKNENLSDSLSVSDGSKDTRTSSTDSGFHDIEIYEPNDKDQIKMKSSKEMKKKFKHKMGNLQQIQNPSNDESSLSKSNNEIQMNENNNQTVIFQDVEELKENINETIKDYPDKVKPLNTIQHISESIDKKSVSLSTVSKHLNLSLFKFKFINDSDLNEQYDKLCYVNNGNVNSSSNTETVTKSNKIHNNGKQYQHITDSQSTFIDIQLEKAQLSNNGSNSEISVLELNSNTNQCNCAPEDMNLINQSNLTMNTDNIVVNCNRISSIKKYNPFRVNYYSPDYMITNEEEITQFLYFKWLKFCEKYTIYNHNL